MQTSKANVIAPDITVTPDLVAQKSAQYGVVAEAKRTLGRNQDHWDDHVVQLRKYDDDLEGWWTSTGSVEESNAALLIHQSRSRLFITRLRAAKERDPARVGPRSAVVEFNQSDEARPYIFFRTEWGEFGDAELHSQLETGVPVPIEDVLRSFAAIEFYDAEPPLPFLLELLWNDVFAAMAAGIAHDDKVNAIPVPVDLDDVTTELQRAYGSRALERDARSADFPRKIWIRAAFEALVRANLAVRAEKEASYTVLYRAFKTDVLERFVDLLAKPGKGEVQDGQLPLNLPSAAEEPEA